jgi:hypothetical protein
MGSCLRRGLIAGLVAGLVAGAFHFMVAEPLIEKALRYEVVPTGGESVEVFSRTVQRLGLLGATALYGAAIGGLFGFAYFFLAYRLRVGSTWERCLRLAAAAFAAVWLVPFLKYPTNPPAVGDPSTINLRTSLYLAMLAVSVAAAIGAWIASNRLLDRGLERHRRHLIIAGGYLGLISVAYILFPANPDPVSIPALLLWNVRLVSAAGQALLWGLVGVGFALLSLRAERGAVIRT